jgi:MSHA biogenesis protein MshM
LENLQDLDNPGGEPSRTAFASFLRGLVVFPSRKLIRSARQPLHLCAAAHLHTYHSTLRILCEAFQIETDGVDFRCEKRLIEEARRLNSAGKMLAPIIDDAHLMEVSALRRLRLLFEDFPKNHCLVLVAQPELLSRLALTVNEDIKNRVTYSVLMQKMAPDSLSDFVRAELDKVALAHSTFSDDALALIVRSSEGVLRRLKNICLGPLLEAVRDRTKVVELKQVNRVLLQPHWRKEADLPQ